MSNVYMYVVTYNDVYHISYHESIYIFLGFYRDMYASIMSCEMG